MNNKHFHISNKSIYHNSYKYRDCGLDNIYLLNGFHKENIDGEEFVSIENIDSLWKAIGIHIATQATQLAPAEVRFLRHYMDKTQAELAAVLKVSDQTVARWEKGKTELPGAAELALRLMFLVSPLAQPDGMEIVTTVLERIAKGTPPKTPIANAAFFARETDQWHAERQAA